MVPCESCGCHVRLGESGCPFCGGGASFTRLRNLAGAAVASWVLTACYGSAVSSSTTCLGTYCPDTADDTATLPAETGDTGP